MFGRGSAFELGLSDGGWVGLSCSVAAAFKGWRGRRVVSCLGGEGVRGEEERY